MITPYHIPIYAVGLLERKLMGADPHQVRGTIVGLLIW